MCPRSPTPLLAASPTDLLRVPSVRAFDETQTPYHTLEAAMAAFLEPETLDGDNAYYCEACAEKQPALKGIRVSRLPPILGVGLKRFDFDLRALARVKLHHDVLVPLMLDMHPFFEGGAVARHHKAKRKLMGGGTPTGTPSAILPATAPLEAIPLLALPLADAPDEVVDAPSPGGDADDQTAASLTAPAAAQGMVGAGSPPPSQPPPRSHCLPSLPNSSPTSRSASSPRR